MSPKSAFLLCYVSEAHLHVQVWPRGQFPLRPVGELVLNRNPEDYHRDVEQVCFSPGSFVPGIEASPDALLQWRTFLYVHVVWAVQSALIISQLPRCPVLQNGLG
jgi:catalase